jgi:hypothetical protein
MTPRGASHGPGHFRRLYEASQDPWQYRTSAYEQSKYRRTVASLGARRFHSGFEAGCSIGVLTRLLALRCERLLAVDIVEQPLRSARAMCDNQPWVRLERMEIPGEWPDDIFDLIVLSEVLYFLSPADIGTAADRVIATLEPSGVVLLVNWRGHSHDPCTGDEAAAIFMNRTRRCLSSQMHYQESGYRLDVLYRG